MGLQGIEISKGREEKKYLFRAELTSYFHEIDGYPSFIQYEIYENICVDIKRSHVVGDNF